MISSQYPAHVFPYPVSKNEIKKMFPKESLVKKLFFPISDSEKLKKFRGTRDRIKKVFTESQITKCLVEDEWPKHLYKYIATEEIQKLPLYTLKKKQIDVFLFAKTDQEFFIKARLGAIPTDSLIELMNLNKLPKKYYKLISPKPHFANLKISHLGRKPMGLLFPMKSKKEFVLSKERFSHLSLEEVKDAIEKRVLDRKYYDLLSDQQLAAMKGLL